MGEMIASRRTFLKAGALAGLGALGAGALGAGALASCAPQSAKGTSTGTASSADVKWDGAFDVVVVGFGAAGASAAIAAADAGAQVLLVDKAPEGHEGGNSRYCAQLYISVTDVDKGLQHYQALRGDFYTPDDVLKAYVQGMSTINDTLIGWGADKSKMVDLTDKKISNLTVEYPELPGAEAIRTNLVDGTVSQAGLWRLLKRAVVSRKDKIDCWYESPATGLVQDPGSKAVVGVQFKRDNKTVSIAAKNGIVMALGGYEASSDFTQQYMGYTKMFPIGSLYNEGDGLIMAQQVGAKLWHMNSWESNGTGLAQKEDRMRNLSTRTFFTSGSVILVGADGRRYVAEDLEQRHGHLKIGGTWMLPARPDHNYYVFDEAQKADLEAGKAAYYATFKLTSIDDMVSAGRIVKAASLDELASHFGIDAEGLKGTVALFNTGAASGVDGFGREAKNMRAFGDGPFYGMEVFPSVLNSQGGPERSANAEVLGTDGKPLPHFYSAGEYGGVNAHYYQGGGNIAECVIFGKLSGEQAASAKDDAVDVKADSLQFKPGCGDQSVYDQSPDASGLSAGQAVGVGEGLGGPIWVKVTADGTTVTKVEIMRATETEGVGDAALNQLPDAIAKVGNADVDTVSGATVTSIGVIAAVKDALTKL